MLKKEKKKISTDEQRWTTSTKENGNSEFITHTEKSEISPGEYTHVHDIRRPCERIQKEGSGAHRL